MKNNYKILIATDYSEAVKNAERYAIQFAKSTGSSLTMMHVYQLPLVITPANPLEFAQTTDDWKKSELDKLESHRKQLFAAMQITEGEIEYDCIVHAGDISEQVCKEANASDMDFVVAGTHGATGFRKVLFGNNAWRIINHSAVPVLAIPEYGLYTKINHIVFATEQREGEIRAINYLTKLAEAFDSELTVLHIANETLSKEYEEGVFEKFKKQITDVIHYKKLKVTLTFNDDIIDGINNFCNTMKADWLVMSPEKPTLLEKIVFADLSTTKQMVLSAHLPLLSIPDYYAPEFRGFWKLFEIDEAYLDEEF